jgi:hypothetical protein
VIGLSSETHGNDFLPKINIKNFLIVFLQVKIRIKIRLMIASSSKMKIPIEFLLLIVFDLVPSTNTDPDKPRNEGTFAALRQP